MQKVKTKMSNKDTTEIKYLAALSKIPQHKTLLLAVSGGADSMCMLFLTQRFAKLRKLDILVASINHNLRSKKESQKDIDLVEKFCKELAVPCFIKIAEPGAIEEIAYNRKKGLEEAARFFRYEFLDICAKEQGADYILTAHNQNDNLETILARFLQGSLSSSGMTELREHYFKPLLDCSRKEIETYIKKEKIPYSIDKTNLKNVFFRNKIRNILMPFLDKKFYGWQKAVLMGAKKKAADELYLSEVLEEYSFEFLDTTESFDTNNMKSKLSKSAKLSKEQFFSLPQALQIRLLYKTFSQLSVESRVSFPVIEAIVNKKPIKTAEIEVFFTKKDIIVDKKECNNFVKYGTISNEIKLHNVESKKRGPL